MTTQERAVQAAGNAAGDVPGMAGAGGGATGRAGEGGAAPVPGERVAVDFAGDGEGVDEMSWGMWEIWQAMGRQEAQMPIGGRAALAPGTTMEDVVAEMRYLMERFPSMRTRLRFAPGGRARQHLFATGRNLLDVHDAPPGTDPDELAAAVEQDFRDREYDWSGEWPVRMAVVRQHGRPTHLVTVMHHLVADGLGGAIMLDQVRRRDTAPVRGMQQLEQARWQRSPAGRRQSERALRHFESVLRTMPSRQLPGPTDPREPRHWGAQFRSPALTAALPRIVARTATGVPGILLGLFAVALNRAMGMDTAVIRPVVGNRFRAAFADVVCMVAQAGVCAIDVAGASVDEVIERARGAGMTANKHAYFDPEALDELVARISVERGEDANIRTYLNNRSTYAPSAQEAADVDVHALARDLEAARARTTFEWTVREHTQVERLFVHVDDADDGNGGLRFEIRIDTHYVSPAQAEAFAYAMEAAAIEAAVPEAVAGSVAEVAPEAVPAGLAPGEGAQAEPVEAGR